MPKKKDPDTKYGAKLIKMFADLLFSGRSRSMTEMAERLECSKPTVGRLAADIESYFGAKLVRETQGRRLFYSIPKARKINVPPLSESELAVMEMCQAFTRHLLGRRQFQEAANGLLKSHGHTVCEPPGSGREFACFSPGSIDYTPHQEVLQSLIEAITKRRVCKISYRGLGAAKARSYHIAPLKLFSHKETVYVHARRSRPNGDPLTDESFYPLLAVHRFKRVEILETAYEPPKDYDFETFFNQTFGVTKQETFRVEVELRGWAASFAAERIWSRNQEIKDLGDGKIRLAYDAASEPEVLSWILGLADEARLIGPAWLKRRLVEKLADMARIYEFSKMEET